MTVDVVASWTGARADALREALRMSNEGFAAHLGVAARTVANWRARPEVVPRPAAQEILDAALARAPFNVREQFRMLLSADGRRADSRETSSENKNQAEVDASPTGLWTPDGTLSAVAEVSEGSPMDRRQFLVLSGSTLTSPAHEWLIARPSNDLSSQSGRFVGTSIVDNLRRITDELRRMDDQIGSGPLVQVVRSQASYVTDLLKNGRYTDSVSRDLYGMLAELLRLAGWLSFDAGRHGQAQRFFTAGLRSAHTAGDRALGANILGFMSCQAKDIGQFTESARFADSARTGYAGTSPTVSAILNMRAAQAYANLKDAVETRRAIDAAFDVFGGNPPGHGEPPWSYWFNEAQMNEQVGYCYMRLGDWERARDHLSLSTGVTGGPDTREGALRQALLADTYAQQGDPDSACAIGNQAIDALTNEVDSARCVGHVKQVRQHLVPYHRLSVVQEFNERVEALSKSIT